MNHANQSQDLQDSEQAGMRAVPGFGHETGRLTGVTLTRRPPCEGARIGVLAARPDLDAAVPPLHGWHWFEDGGNIVCELAPTTYEVLAQVADDVCRDSLGAYRLHGHDPSAEQLREAATRRMSLPPDEAQFQCARILRDYDDDLRRIEVDEKG